MKKKSVKKNRTAIGFFVTKLDYEYQKEIWRGICDEAVCRDIDIICFPGEIIQSKYRFESQANVIYQLAGRENVDGIIILASTIGQCITKDELYHFIRSYQALPVVSIGLTFENVPSVIAENKTGLFSLIEHLITGHRCRKFAFISGPRGHQEAEERFNVFRDVLANHGIPFDDRQYIQGDFLEDSGKQAVDTLMNTLKGNVDAIVAANDSMAIGVLEALQARGISVPKDIIVTGYDNIRESQNYTPPLTTVNQPIYTLGQKALQLIAGIVGNEKTPPNIVLPSHAVIRQSCGCFSHIAKQVFINDTATSGVSFSEDFLSYKDDIIEECSDILNKNPMSHLTDDQFKEQVRGLIVSFYNDMKNPNSEALLSMLNTILHDSVIKGIEVTYWHEIISLIRKYVLRFNLSREALIKAENICEQARVLIGDTSRRYQAYIRIQLVKRTDRLREVGNTLISNFDLDKLSDVLVTSLSALQIRQCYLALYRHESKVPDTARLFLAYKSGKPLVIKGKNRSYKSRTILPPGLSYNEHRCTMILEPLYFQYDQFGFLFCEMFPDEPVIFDTLRQQISITLKGAFLLEEIKQYAGNLEKQVAKRTRDLTISNRQLEEEIQLRKKVEESLKESEKNLRAITEATPIPLVIIRMNDGHILYANKPFCKTFGIKSEYDKEISLQDFLYDREFMKELHHKLRKENHLSNVEIPVHNTDGHDFWVISSFQKMIFKGERCILAGFYDLTERRKLEREVLEVIGNERRRIGQDLHDDICQDMVGIGAIASVIENQLIKVDPQKAEKASYLRQLIKNTIIKTKSLAKGLYPAELEYSGLIEMLKELASSVQVQFKISCHIIFDIKVEIEDNLLNLHLYRIVQESVTNAVQHGKPSHIEITINSMYDKVELVVTDNGIGIPKKYESSGGMGIRSMRYRANVVGGKLNIKKNRGGGTTVTCIIPRKK
ncbi:MAG: substrate-binding domain-containing protein [Spirochaetales bacterium]|nr:substrate-binding domain-containing protein [Spirochaetales bacterium]